MSAYSDQNTVVSSPEDFQINAGVDKRVVIKPEDYSWTDSPMAEVEQMVLEQVSGELVRTTTIVRYNPNSEFPSRAHNGCEEIFVLEGSFTDENGKYQAGTYVRNPVGTTSTSRVGTNGTTLFVKSHQFAKNDTKHIVIDTNTAAWHPGLINGLHVMPLHEGEHVALVRWAPHTKFQPHSHWGGEEILVLDGVFYDEHDRYPKGTWIRSPHLSQHTPFTKEEGALIYVKVGHLSPSNVVSTRTREH